MNLSGQYVGQVLGPFTANQDLLANDGPIGIFTPEQYRPKITKIGIQADCRLYKWSKYKNW